MNNICEKDVNGNMLWSRLSWGGGSTADVDLQAVIVDKSGKIIDAAYYNNMKACGKAVTHSGDEAVDRANGAGKEELRITLKSLPDSVHMVFFVACCFSGGTLANVKDGKLEFILDKETLFEVVPSTTSYSTGLLAALLIRRRTNWALRLVEQEMKGQHFMDCLDELNTYIVAEIPTASRKQKVAFAMDKGDVVDFGSALESVRLGLGWTVRPGQEIDLDASAVILGHGGEVLECIFFGNLASIKDHSTPGAVTHSGDNLTGAGEGDNEQVTVNMSMLGPAVKNVFFAIHIYTSEHGRALTFSRVLISFCRVVDAVSNEELCRYNLREAGDLSGLVIARLERSGVGRWSFQALGTPSKGTMYKDSIPDMQQIAKMTRQQLQHSASAVSLITPAAAATPASQGGAEASCCSIS